MNPNVWLVFAGLSITVVEAHTEELARKTAITKLGVEHKPYLARDWTVRRPRDEEELARYAAHADGYRPAQPTVKTAPRPGKKPKKTTKERLF